MWGLYVQGFKPVQLLDIATTQVLPDGALVLKASLQSEGVMHHTLSLGYALLQTRTSATQSPPPQ